MSLRVPTARPRAYPTSVLGTLVLSLASVLAVGCGGESGQTATEQNLNGDSNLTQEGEFVIVKRSACLNGFGSVVEGQSKFMCDGGKYDGLIVPGPAADPHLTKEGNSVIVRGIACLANGGSITTDSRYAVCDGGKYDGYIAGENFDAENDENLSKEGPTLTVRRSACLESLGSVIETSRYFQCDGGTYDGIITQGAAGDPNITREGNLATVGKVACLANGGKISSEDRRYFTCDGGKYDGMITGE